ncbi:MAG: HlyD family efflux transporter periplasmic adaptor subunit [Anaerovoracaceae bacterium]|nr:HlyD family efflux transporter periplasmic adaptor subunit [Anaerovoracaceae bacterium]
MPKLKKKTIYIFAAALVALYLVISVIPTVTGKLTPTQTVEYGEFKVSDDVTGYVVRDETVYLASETGDAVWKVGEGDLIKKGAAVMTFKKRSGKDDKKNSRYEDILKKLDGKGRKTGTASLRKGVVSFYVDGYEGRMTPSKQKKLRENDVSVMDAQPDSIKRDSFVKGEPVYKIYNNAKWYMNVWVDDSKTSRYKEGNDVTIEIGDEKIKGSIERIIAEDKKWHIIIKTNRYWSGLGKYRVTDCSIVTTDEEGLIIDNSCIAMKGKHEGVYVKTTSGGYKFTRVNVIASNDEQSLVSSGTFTDDRGKTVNTVEVYDEILKNPKEG